MATLNVVDLTGKKVGDVELSDNVFAGNVNEALIYEYVRMQMARRRGGNAKTKGRGEIRGGGRKPFRQKGTGRARQGSSRAPQYTGGGTVHGPQPRSYAYTIPRKARQGALRSVLSLKNRDEALVVLDELSFPEIKTKHALQVFEGGLGLKNALIVDVDKDEIVYKSVRNLPHYKFLQAAGFNVRDVLRYDTLVLTKRAAETLNERLS